MSWFDEGDEDRVRDHRGLPHGQARWGESDVEPILPRRLPLAGGRQLVVSRLHGLVLVAVAGLDGSCLSGPLALRPEDVGAAVAALTLASLGARS